jgi:hypothetical protein
MKHSPKERMPYNDVQVIFFHLEMTIRLPKVPPASHIKDSFSSTLTLLCSSF